MFRCDMCGNKFDKIASVDKGGVVIGMCNECFKKEGKNENPVNKKES